MRPGRLTIAGAAAAALIGAPAAWYYGSPWWTLWRIREAARAGDMAALASHVDFHAVADHMNADNHSAWNSVLATVTPDSPGRRELIALAKRRLELRVSDAAAKQAALPWLSQLPIRFLGLDGDPRYRPHVVRHRLDHFEVRDRGASVENGPRLGFRREGFGWKLEEMDWGQQ